MKLSVEGLNSHYGPAHILFDIALDVDDGEVVALLGRNGAGKSTTFRSIVGLVEQRTGRIMFEGKDVSAQPTHAIVSRGLQLGARGLDLPPHPAPEIDFVTQVERGTEAVSGDRAKAGHLIWRIALGRLPPVKSMVSLKPQVWPK